ncbi:MAG: radical SAM protein [Planctomycetota bacterium]
MRRQYLDLVVRRLKKGDWRFPFRAARSVSRAIRGEDQPLLGTLIVTYRCDLDCEMCDLPLRGDRKRELDTAGFRDVLDGFADLGVLGVGITGGEPLLREDLPELVAHGTRRGLLMHINTNGTLLDDSRVRALADAGVASFNISLDGPDAETHDRLRGRTGSFQRVLRAAARLIALPDRAYRVALTCALGEDNVSSVPALLARARDVGVDRVGFLPVHELKGDQVSTRSVDSNGAMAALLERCGQDPLLDNSQEYLGLFPMAYAGEKNPVACVAPRTSVVVDCFGEIFPCVPLNAVRRPVGSGDVREVWRSDDYKAVRESLHSCRECFWNCHTEMNLALARLGGRR